LARTLAILTITLTGITSMYAGSLGINPGDYLNPNGTVSIGLLPNTGVESGTGLVANPDGITGTAFAQRNYSGNSAVLNGGTIGTSTTTGTSTGLPQSLVTCTVNCQGGKTTVSSAPGTATIYSPPGAPEFDLLGDGSLANDASNANFWYSLSNGTGTQSTLTIPVGIFGVNTVSTMLNTVAGIETGGTVGGNAAAYASISFEFQDAADFALGNSNGLVFETLALINGVTQENIMDGAGNPAYSDTLCTPSNTAGNACSYTGTDLGTNAGGSLKVSAGTEWLGNVNGGNTTMNLDYQTFTINPNYTGDVLKAIIITDTGTAATSHEMLSGITVSETPEPSTILLLLAGFGAMGVSRLRRKVS